MTVHIKPSGDGYEYGREGEEQTTCEDRATAIKEARVLAGVQTYDLVDPNGETHGQHTTPAQEAVVLLRGDGSVYGELDPAPSSSDGPAQHVDVEPVESSDNTGGD